MFTIEICRSFFITLWYISVFASSAEYKISSGCPESCNCTIQSREWSHVKCDSSQFHFHPLDDLKLDGVQPPIIQLELWLNITHLENSFLKLFALEKLDLRDNGIEQIDNDAFLHLRNLKRLDLSHNKISNLHEKIFEPLNSLERLKLNNNIIVHLFKGVFQHLTSLKFL